MNSGDIWKNMDLFCGINMWVGLTGDLLTCGTVSLQAMFDTALNTYRHTHRPATHTATRERERRWKVRPCGHDSWRCWSTPSLPPPPSFSSPSFAPQAKGDLSRLARIGQNIACLCGRAPYQSLSSSLTSKPSTAVIHHQNVTLLLGSFHPPEPAQISMCGDAKTQWGNS